MVLGIVKKDAVCRLLMTVPGVGPVTALTVRTGVDVPWRFNVLGWSLPSRNKTLLMACSGQTVCLRPQKNSLSLMRLSEERFHR